MKYTAFALLLFLFIACDLTEKSKITRNDYDRAVSYLRSNYQNKTVFNLHVDAHWFSNNQGLWYLYHEPGNKQYLKITFPDYEKSALFDHKKLAEALSEELEKEISPTNLPIDRIDTSDGQTLEISVNSREFELNTDTYEFEEVSEESTSNANEIASPDAQWKAFPKDYNLYIKSGKTGAGSTTQYQRQKEL